MIYLNRCNQENWDEAKFINAFTSIEEVEWYAAWSRQGTGWPSPQVKNNGV